MTIALLEERPTLFKKPQKNRKPRRKWRQTYPLKDQGKGRRAKIREGG
jgi:hypothetical protein